MITRTKREINKHRRRLVEVIHRRIDREYPMRRWWRLLVSLASLATLFIGFAKLEPVVFEFVLLGAFLLFIVEEIARLRHRAPRPRWLRFMMETMGGGAGMWLFTGLLYWVEGDTEEVLSVVYFMLVMGAILLMLFCYGAWRYGRLKREIEETKDAIHRRMHRQRKLERL